MYLSICIAGIIVFTNLLVTGGVKFLGIAVLP